MDTCAEMESAHCKENSAANQWKSLPDPGELNRHANAAIKAKNQFQVIFIQKLK
jgi:hypothetical protein